MSFSSIARRLGVLRTGLAVVTALVIVAAPFADGTVHMHDWRLFPSVIAPTIVMMLLFVFPLDLVMTRVFMADAAAPERDRLRLVCRVDMILFLVLIGAWLPFMFRVLDFTPFS